jgi:hypothetical protein
MPPPTLPCIDAHPEKRVGDENRVQKQNKFFFFFF